MNKTLEKYKLTEDEIWESFSLGPMTFPKIDPIDNTSELRAFYEEEERKANEDPNYEPKSYFGS